MFLLYSTYTLQEKYRYTRHGRLQEPFQRGGQNREDCQELPVFRRAVGANENFRDVFGVLDLI